MGPSLWQGERSVFSWRRYICCSVVSARVYPLCHSIHAPVGTVHLLSLHYTKQHLDSTYRGFLSLQAHAAGYALTDLIYLDILKGLQLYNLYNRPKYRVL
jgi:hypothetical protein